MVAANDIGLLNLYIKASCVDNTEINLTIS